MTPEQKQRIEQIERTLACMRQMVGGETSVTNAYAKTYFEHVDFLLSLVKEQEAEYGYWPTLTDRGDGVKGHYCIGRLIKPGEPYWEYWNKGQWSSAGEVFIGNEAAQAQLEAVRGGIGYADPLDNDAVDSELHRWQEAIRDKLIDLGAPDWKIDGAGCAWRRDHGTVDHPFTCEDLSELPCKCGHLFREHKRPQDTAWDVCSFPCGECSCEEFWETSGQ